MPLITQEGSCTKENHVHFTYKDCPDMSSLCQGDILKITEEIRDVLKEIHPYFLNEQYKYFMVLTQSCDLVRRGGSKCKTPYITLAAVRNFSDFFEKQLQVEKYAEKVNEYLLMNAKKKERAYQFLERLYNNTEPDYFFLYKEDALNFPESMIASLKVSIALKSELHYDQCLSAKVLELSDEFKAKLGWLVGNIYSRVGTTDWESLLSSQERKDMLDEELKSHCMIASAEQIKALKTAFEKHSEPLETEGDVVQFISNCHIESQYDKAIGILENIINSMGKEIPKEEKEKLIRRVKNKATFKALFPSQM